MQQNENMFVELLKDCLTASCYDESAWQRVDLREKRSLANPVKFVRGMARGWIMNFLDRKNLVVLSPKPYDTTLRNEGRDWPFIGYTMVGRKRLDNVQACVEDVLANHIPGDFAETGVWRGGTVILMAGLLKLAGQTDRKIWAADSFEGLPVPDSESDGADLSENAYLKVSLEQVKANFARFGLLSDQIQFLKGWFCDTLPTAPIEKLAILRLDGDLYSSTMDALRSLYHKVSPGGYVIVDDYFDWEGCRMAITDFLKEHNLGPELKPIDKSAVYWKVMASIEPGLAGIPAGVAAGSHAL